MDLRIFRLAFPMVVLFGVTDSQYTPTIPPSQDPANFQNQQSNSGGYQQQYGSQQYATTVPPSQQASSYYQPMSYGSQPQYGSQQPYDSQQYDSQQYGSQQYGDEDLISAIRELAAATRSLANMVQQNHPGNSYSGAPPYGQSSNTLPMSYGSQPQYAAPQSPRSSSGRKSYRKSYGRRPRSVASIFPAPFIPLSEYDDYYTIY